MDIHLLDGIEDIDAFLASKNEQQKKVILDYLIKVEQYKKYNKIKFFEPEEWQRRAIEKGKTEDFRMVCAGNRLGKSYYSTYETAIHATGLYPDDWKGYKFKKPLNMLVMGWDWSQINRPKCTAELLLGTSDARGAGWLPKSEITKIVPKIGMQNTVAAVYVKHYDENGFHDGDTRITFDVYSAGFATLMGMEVDFALLDEQVPADIFSQVKKRLWSSRGKCLYVASPEKGLDDTIKQFWDESGTHHEGLIHVTLWDSTLFTEEEKKKMNEQIEPWARAFSIEGIPSAGSGAVFAGISKDTIIEPCPDIGKDWIRMSASDLGFKDDMSFTFITKDPKTGTYYLYKEKVFTETDAIICASAIKPLQSGYIPLIIPADGDSERGLGATYRSIFEGAGLVVCKEQARNWMTDPEGKDRSIRGGIIKMREMMKAGLFKVDPSCESFLKEFGLYSYDSNGKFIDKYNHTIDSCRYCFMAIDTFGVSEQDHLDADLRKGPSQSDWDTFYAAQDAY